VADLGTCHESPSRTVAVLQIFFFVGLAVAYLTAGAGLVGFLDARTVSKFILIGSIVAFVAMLFYFGASDLEFRRRLRRQF